MGNTSFCLQLKVYLESFVSCSDPCRPSTLSLVKNKMTCSKTLFDIHDVVPESLLPLLNINDILRLRRVCHWTKTLAEDYLRRHPFHRRQSKEDVECINMKRDEDGKGSLKEFLDKDHWCSIRKPNSSFYLSNFYGHDRGSVARLLPEHPLLTTFLARYGNRINRLGVYNISLPLQKEEWTLYEKLENLKTLEATILTVNASMEGPVPSDLDFPSTFRSIKKLRLTYIDCRDASQQNLVWNLIQFCTKLEFFHFPTSRIFNELPEDDRFTNMYNVLKSGHHKHFKTVDFRHLCFQTQLTLYSPALWEMTLRYGIKWKNVILQYLSSLEAIHVEKIASSIISATYITKGRDECSGVPLPNLKTLDLRIKGVDAANTFDHWVEVPYVARMERIRRNLSSVILPSLTKLVLRFFTYKDMRVAGFERLSVLWSCFPLLKEVSFRGNLGDALLIGPNDERPFLQLKYLKTVVFVGCGDQWFTDLAFIKIFRHMRLREFLIYAKEPVTSFTSAGLWALLSGPFRETIQSFPFKDFNLAGVDEEQLQELIRAFPGNAEV